MKKITKVEKIKIEKIEEVEVETFEFTREEVLFIARIFGPFTERKLESHLQKANASEERRILFKMHDEIFKAFNCKL